MGQSASKCEAFGAETGAEVQIVVKENQKKLKATSANIRSIADSISIYSELLYLNLSNNFLVALPSAFGRLGKIRTLLLARNCLRELPDSIGYLHSLEELSLEHNQLEALPKTLCGLYSLQTLNVGYNQLNSLPRELGQLDCLRELSIHHNKIGALPIELTFIRDLHHIETQGCPLYEAAKSSRYGKIHTHLSRPSLFSTPTKPPERCLALQTTIPPLRSIVARSLHTLQAFPATPQTLRAFLLTAEECSFCRKLFFAGEEIYRVRLVRKHGRTIPFYYTLCSRHWDSEAARNEMVVEQSPPRYKAWPKTALFNNFAAYVQGQREGKPADALYSPPDSKS